MHLYLMLVGQSAMRCECSDCGQATRRRLLSEEQWKQTLHLCRLSFYIGPFSHFTL